MKVAKAKLVRRIGGAVVASSVFLVAFAASQASAAVLIGIKFGPAASNVTGTAGAVPIANWNNIGTSTTATALTASDGTSSGATETLTGYTGTWTSGVAADGGNGSLMSGYIDDGKANPTTSTITGLTPGGVYDVYIYAQGDQNHPADAGQGLPSYSVNGQTVYIDTVGGTTATATLTAATPQAAGPVGSAYDASQAGNYVLFPGVVAAGGTIAVTAEVDPTIWRSPLNGIELVQSSAVPEPASLGLLALGAAATLFGRRRSMRA